MTGSDEGVQSGTVPLVMSPAQSRAARGLLGWSEADLASKAGIEASAVRSFESGYGDSPSGQIEALRSVFTAAGVVFTQTPMPGVSLGITRDVDEGTRLDRLTTENDR